jgi:hypothetical protein
MNRTTLLILRIFFDHVEDDRLAFEEEKEGEQCP